MPVALSWHQQADEACKGRAALPTAPQTASSVANISGISHSPPQTAAGTRPVAPQGLPSKSV